jgi:hypothetical protein
VALATDVIRMEIALWARVDARLASAHELPVAFFKWLHLLSGALKTYEAVVAGILDGVVRPEEQRRRDCVGRLVAALHERAAA